MDFALLEDGTVILRETKFAKRLQFDDFTAITQNLRSNVAEIRSGLRGHTSLARAQKGLIRATLDDFLAGGLPPNLKIQVQTGKTAVGLRLQNRLRQNVSGLPIEFLVLP